jgi:hypothetical protein
VPVPRIGRAADFVAGGEDQARGRIKLERSSDSGDCGTSVGRGSAFIPPTRFRPVHLQYFSTFSGVPTTRWNIYRKRSGVFHQGWQRIHRARSRSRARAQRSGARDRDRTKQLRRSKRSSTREINSTFFDRAQPITNGKRFRHFRRSERRPWERKAAMASRLVHDPRDRRPSDATKTQRLAERLGCLKRPGPGHRGLAAVAAGFPPAEDC